MCDCASYTHTFFTIDESEERERTEREREDEGNSKPGELYYYCAPALELKKKKKTLLRQFGRSAKCKIYNFVLQMEVPLWRRARSLALAPIVLRAYTDALAPVTLNQLGAADFWPPTTLSFSNPLGNSRINVDYLTCFYGVCYTFFQGLIIKTQFCI